MELLEGKLSLAGNIYNHLLTQISNGIYAEGDKLPSEKELCTLYGVSRISVRSALQRLEALGIIETLHGKGSYVKRTVPDPDSGFRPEVPTVNSAEVQSYQLLSHHDFEEVWHFRYGMFSQALSLFSARAAKADFDILDDFIQKIIDTSTEKELCRVLVDYDSYIYNHCGNRYIANVMNQYDSVMLSYIYTIHIRRKQSRSQVVQYHMQTNERLRSKNIPPILKSLAEENILVTRKDCSGQPSREGQGSLPPDKAADAAAPAKGRKT